MTHPLEDLDYKPRYLPVNGKPNPAVAKWGPASQLRWFRRFWGTVEMPMLFDGDLADFYCSSTEHKGACCPSCIDEQESGYFYIDDCCCRAHQ